jgi:hypothetical protein
MIIPLWLGCLLIILGSVALFTAACYAIHLVYTERRQDR